MKKTLTFLLVTCSLYLGAQQSNFKEELLPVKTNISWLESNHTYELIISLEIDSTWIVYDSIAGEGPLPLSIRFESLDNFTVDSIVKPSLHKKYDELFDADIYYIEGIVKYSVNFKKSIQNATGSVAGYLEFMSCNLSTGICLPPVNNSFSFQQK